MLHNESNLKTMAEMNADSVDLVVTSPPYTDLRAYHGFTFDFEATAKALYRVLKPVGVIVWIVGDKTDKGSEMGIPFQQALFFKSIGFKLHDTMIWTAARPPKTHRRYEQAFEYMFVFCKGDLKTFNPIMEKCKYAGKFNSKSTFRHSSDAERAENKHTIAAIKDFRIKSNVWHILSGRDGKTASEHPAIFPVKLVMDHIYSWSNAGDLVYDPFMGSGTTAVAAKMMGRRWIGSEISSKYCEIIKRRLAETDESLPEVFSGLI